jgi:hypothetical protein
MSLAAARQQRPVPACPQSQFEIRGLDFGPMGRGASELRTCGLSDRHCSPRATWPCNAQAVRHTAVTGQFYVPVIPIRFANTDTTTSFPVSEYQDLFFSAVPVTRPYSVKTYYEQLSNGLIQMTGTVFPWVRTDSTDVYYEDDCNGIGVYGPCPHARSRFAEMIYVVLNEASTGPDSATVWAQFDTTVRMGLQLRRR